MIATVLVGLGAAAWVYRQPKVYESTCSVVIDPMAPQVLQGVKEVVELGTGSYWANREFYETQYRIIRSKEVAQRVVDRLGLSRDPDYPYPKAAQDRAKESGSSFDFVSYLIGQIRVAAVKDSRIANITVADRDPKRAAQIANAVADSYIDRNLEHKLEGARNASDWLGDQVVTLTDKLKRSELTLYEYRRSKQLLDVSLDARQNMTTQNVQAFNEKLTDVRAKRIELESNRKLILAAKDDIEKQESLPEIRQNPVIQQLRVTYVDVAKIKAELESSYGERHPKIEGINRKLESIRADYVSEINKVLKSNENAYQSIIETEKALVRLMEQEKREAIELAKLEVEYRPLAREAENDQKLYSLIIQRQKETGLTGLIRTNNVRILDSAVPQFLPVKPRVKFSIALGLIAGLVLGIGCTFLLESLDNTIKTQEQVEAILQVPVLGMVPIIGERAEKQLSPELLRDRDLGVFRNPKSSAAEACRSIRTNLLFVSPERALRSLVITSPGPQEGKTTTAISVGITMAQAGARVLLVDTDLRRPRMHRSFGVPNDRGVSNIIVGDASLDKVVRATEVPNLDLLTCGPIPPNPAELLHTRKFNELMQQLAERYDRVIYDSPPTSLVTDPAVIANMADGVVLVLRGGSTSRDDARYARRQLTDAKARVVGVVINYVDLTDRTYNHYYSRYYRAYGYGNYGGEENAPA